MLGPKPVTRVTLITIQNTTLKIIIQDWSVDVKTKQDTYMYGPQANLSSVCTMSYKEIDRIYGKHFVTLYDS